MSEEKLITISVAIPESEYLELKRISQRTGLSMGSLYRLKANCPPCFEGLKRGLEQWESSK